MTRTTPIGEVDLHLSSGWTMLAVVLLGLPLIILLFVGGCVIAAHDAPDFHWHTNFVALEYWHFQKTEGLLWYEAMLELFPREVVELHHSWEVQQLKGTPLWLAWAKGVPLPWKERRMLERIAP